MRRTRSATAALGSSSRTPAVTWSIASGLASSATVTCGTIDDSGTLEALEPLEREWKGAKASENGAYLGLALRGELARVRERKDEGYMRRHSLRAARRVAASQVSNNRFRFGDRDDERCRARLVPATAKI